MRRPISANDYMKKEPLRTDKIFEDQKGVLSNASTLLSYEWKVLKCRGKFVPVP